MSKPSAKDKKRGGVLTPTRMDKPAAASLWARNNADAMLSEKDERWISESEAAENMKDTRRHPRDAQWR